MRGLLRRATGRVRKHGLWLTALLTVGVFFGLFLVADAGAVWAAVVDVDATVVVAIVVLVTLGYVVRFLKWEYYLRVLDVDVPTRTNLLVFVSGLMFVVTPGKIGELWKAWFLRDLEGVPVSTTAPVVGAERVTDLLALSAFAFLGVFLYRRSPAVIVGVVAVFAAGIGLLQWRTLCLGTLDRCADLPVIGERAGGLRRFYEGAYSLFRPRPLAVALVASLVAWGAEGMALWLVLQGLGAAADPVLALFVFGFGSVIGAVSLLPGGLAATEASMVALLVAAGYTRPLAVSATLVIRLGTLWYGAVLGAAVFGIHRLRGRAERVDVRGSSGEANR